MHAILCKLVNILLASHKCQVSCKTVKGIMLCHLLRSFFFLFFGTHSNIEMLNDTCFGGNPTLIFLFSSLLFSSLLFSSLLFSSLLFFSISGRLRKGVGGGREPGRPGGGDGRDGGEAEGGGDTAGAGGGRAGATVAMPVTGGGEDGGDAGMVGRWVALQVKKKSGVGRAPHIRVLARQTLLITIPDCWIQFG